jgi:membrane protein DedA with SNARE-associated domain
MLSLAIVGTLLGAVLAQRFKIMILIPASAPLIGATIIVGIIDAHPAWRILLMTGAACISTQAGYLIGLRIRRFLEDPSAEKPSTEPSSACRIDSSASGRVV